MSKRGRKFYALWVIFLLLLPQIIACQKSRVNVGQKKIDSIRFKDIRDDVAFFVLADKAHSIICFEDVIAVDPETFPDMFAVIPRSKKVSLDFKDTTLDIVIKELMKQLPHYKYRYDRDNVINIMPRLSTIKEFRRSQLDSSGKWVEVIKKMSIKDFLTERYQTEYPLNKEIAEFSVENKNLSQAMDTLLEHLKANIKNTKFHYWPECNVAYFYVPYGTNRREIPEEKIQGRRMTLKLRNVTVREILNEFAREQGDRYWTSGYSAVPPGCKLWIVFPLWDAKIGTHQFNYYRAKKLREQGKLKESEPYKNVEVDIYPDD